MFKPCPPAGTGEVNLWTFGAACAGVRLGLPEDKIRDYLWEETSHSGAEAEKEIERAIERAFELSGKGAAVPPNWPALNKELRKKAASEGPDLETVRKISPIRDATAPDALLLLFPDNPLLWAARSLRPERWADTLPMREWLPKADKLQFIVPSPMLGREVPPGGYSRRRLANTGPRRYQVVESDSGTVDEQISILWHLARFAPLCAIVLSGGKSAHGWYYVDDRPETLNRLFMERAVSLGADTATWCRAQAVRMPGGYRPEKNAIQEIVFFAPLPTKEVE